MCHISNKTARSTEPELSAMPASSLPSLSPSQRQQLTKCCCHHHSQIPAAINVTITAQPHSASTVTIKLALVIQVTPSKPKTLANSSTQYNIIICRKMKKISKRQPD